MNWEVGNGWDQATWADGRDQSLLTTPWFSHLLVEHHPDQQGEGVLGEKGVGFGVTRQEQHRLRLCGAPYARYSATRCDPTRPDPATFARTLPTVGTPRVCRPDRGYN